MKNYIIVILLFFNQSFCIAQVVNILCSQIKKNNGHSFGLVRCIQKDSFGFVWIGTENGLYKLNGDKSKEYSNYITNSKNTICGNDVTDLIIPKNHNSIVTIQALAGISQIDLITSNVVSRSYLEAIKKRGIVSVCQFENFLYIATVDGGLLKYNYSENKIEKEITLSITSTKTIRKIFIVDKKIVIATENGELFIMHGVTFSLIQKIILPHNELFFWKYNIHYEGNECYFATASGVFYLSTQDKSIVSVKNIIQFDRYYGAIIDYIKIHDGYLIATEKGIFKKINKHWKTVNMSSQDNYVKWNETVQFFDDKNKIWLLTGNGLFLIKSLNPAVEAHHKKFQAGDIHSDVKQLLYYDKNILFKENRNQIDIIDFKNGQTLQSFKVDRNYNLYKNNDGIVYGISEVDEIEISNNSKTNKHFKIKRQKKNKLNLKYHSIFFDKSKVFSFNEAFGTIEKNDLSKNKISTVFRIYESEKKANSSFFRSIRKANDSVFWCILSDKVLEYNIYTCKLKKIEVINPQSNKPYIIIMDIAKFDNNYYLIVNGIGLIKINLENQLAEVFGNSFGFSTLGLMNCSKMSDSSLLISSDNGLFIFNINTRKIKYLNEGDGISNNNFLENAIISDTEKIFLGTNNGFTLINPSKFVKNEIQSKLYFTSLTVEGDRQLSDTNNISIDLFRIPNNYSQVKIEFVSLDYGKQEKLKYLYRIKEFSNNWIKLNNQNYLSLIGIKYGKYHLEVKSLNEEGLESEISKLTLHFLPKWYQTLLFKILFALGIASILYALYRFRIRQLTKIINVRQKISSNLHDDIGSTLSSINMYSQIAQLKPNDANYINTIQKNTQEVLAKLDDIVWATNPKNDKIKSVVERMDNFARPLLQAKQIQFTFTHSEEIVTNKIGEATRQNLFLIFKEAINNVAKYAKCKTCSVDLAINSKTIYCTITDDGIGFDATKPTERNGLINMQHRAEELKGKIEISTILNEGTTVKLQLPL